MASFYSDEDCDTASPIQRSTTYQNDDSVRGHPGVIQVTGQWKPGQSSGSSSKINTSLKRKPSGNSFLAWVAFDRKYSINISEAQRRTCPLIGCEYEFANPELMLQHVYERMPLSRGLYRCFECYSVERIGKYHTKGCKDLHQPKDRLAKVANSLRLAKRLFSRQILKRCPQPSQTAEPDLGVHDSVLETAWFPAELETNWLGNPAELTEDECRAELEVFDGSMFLSADQIFQRGMLSELGNDNDTLPIPESYVRPQYNPAELEVCSETASTTEEQNAPRREQSTLRYSPRHSVHGNERHRNIPFDCPVLKLAIHDICQQQHRTPKIVVPPERHHDPTMDDAVSPLSPEFYGHHYPDTPALSPPTTGRFSGVTTDSCVSPAASRTSTQHSSMSSFDMGTQSVEDNHLPPTNFLDGLDSDVMFSEPEDMDPMPLPASDPIPWYTGPDGFNFGDSFIPPAPRPLMITKKQNRQDTCDLQLDQNPSSLSSAILTQYRITQTVPLSKHRCICGFEPGGKEQNKNSNLKRHQKTCKMCPRTTSQDPYIYICNYLNCGLRYNRSDNLLAHQRVKNHSRDVKLYLIPISPPLSERDWNVFELESREVQSKRRRMD